MNYEKNAKLIHQAKSLRKHMTPDGERSQTQLNRSRGELRFVLSYLIIGELGFAYFCVA